MIFDSCVTPCLCPSAANDVCNQTLQFLYFLDSLCGTSSFSPIDILQLQAMSDLLASLVIPKSSQESFHSTHSQPATNMSSSPIQNQLQTALYQTIPNDYGPDLIIHDVDAFLDLPENKSLLESKAEKSTPTSKPLVSASTAAGPSMPVATYLGTRTSSASVSRFYEACQVKGLTPVFEIEQDERLPQGMFKGQLSVGSKTIVLEQSQLGKKEARQVLAEKGLELVTSMEAHVKRKDDADNAPNGQEENWIGMLFGTVSLSSP